MTELVQAIIEPLLQEPERLLIQSEREDDTVYFSVWVAPGDVGRIVGRQGTTVQSILTVLKSQARREQLQVRLNIKSIEELEVKEFTEVANEEA